MALALAGSFIYQASAATTYSSATLALNKLKVVDEVRTGYVRTKFKHWITISRSGQTSCDTRKSVIIDEALSKPSILPGCVIKGGEWLSIYDNVKVTDASKLDVDHMVPLAEAWDSGASTWTDLKRQQYANDMVDTKHLIAVTGSSNRSKSDQDPAEWMPTNNTKITIQKINEILREIIEEVCPVTELEPKKPWIQKETIELHDDNPDGKMSKKFMAAMYWAITVLTFNTINYLAYNTI